MTIVEALKSGFPLKRRREDKWYCSYHLEIPIWSANDLLADDWEVKEETKTITKSQLINAFGESTHYPSPQILWERLK